MTDFALFLPAARRPPSRISETHESLELSKATADRSKAAGASPGPSRERWILLPSPSEASRSAPRHTSCSRRSRERAPQTLRRHSRLSPSFSSRETNALGHCSCPSWTGRRTLGLARLRLGSSRFSFALHSLFGYCAACVWVDGVPPPLPIAEHVPRRRPAQRPRRRLRPGESPGCRRPAVPLEGVRQLSRARIWPCSAEAVPFSALDDPGAEAPLAEAGLFARSAYAPALAETEALLAWRGGPCHHHTDNDLW